MDLIVNFAPTGVIPTRDMSDRVPLTVDQIVDDVRRAVEIGITMVHLHARDEHGQPTTSKNTYAAMIGRIREFAPDLILGVSLSGRVFTDFAHRSEPLQLAGDLKPDMGSLTLSSLNFNRQASVNEPETIRNLAAEMKSRGIAPELEAFDAGMINYAKYLERKGLLVAPHYFNLLLGNIACAQADLLHAGMMVRDLPPRSYWSMAGIGAFQLPMNSIAIAAGGGVRVGLEDNIWFDAKRTRLASNVDLLERIRGLAEANGRGIMPPSELRRLLKLNPGHGDYGRTYDA